LRDQRKKPDRGPLLRYRESGESMSAFLSKSKYLVGIQCPKLLWTHYNAKHLLPAVDAATQAVFDQGHQVGELAKRLFPCGIEVEWGLGFDGVLAQSRELLAERKPLFEAGFMSGRMYARADVLEPAGDGRWDIFEVKSGTGVKDINLDDLAFQRCCYEGAGLRIRRCRLTHIDGASERHGEVDPEGLFACEDATDAVAGRAAAVPERVAAMLDVIDSKECPEPGIGPHCGDPYECPLKPLCWAHVREHERSVFTVHRLGRKAWDLYGQGIIVSEGIPEGFPLTCRQRIQLDAERTGEPHVDRQAIRRFLGMLEYPLRFLDFETLQAAIPLVDGTRPYQQVPFQWSLHVQDSPGAEPRHSGWLWEGEGDPRRLMLESLERDIGDAGSVVAYNACFERGRLRESAGAFPGHAEWVAGVEGRIVDLLVPFRSFAVYHPGQHGSASIKAVLPALTGRGYEGMEIADGAAAGREFLRVAFGDADETERERVRQALEEYCGLDTMGMVEVVRSLESVAG